MRIFFGEEIINFVFEKCGEMGIFASVIHNFRIIGFSICGFFEVFSM